MWTSLTKGQEDHYDLESTVGDHRLQSGHICKFAKIVRSQAQEGFITEKENFKLNPRRKRKSMWLFYHKSRDIGEPRNAGKQMSTRVKYRLKWSQAGFL